MDILFILLLLAVLVKIWSDYTTMRELADQHCRRLCRQHDLQLLDDSIALKKIYPLVWWYLPWILRRVYYFDYSLEGVERYQGELIFDGKQLVLIHLQHSE